MFASMTPRSYKISRLKLERKARLYSLAVLLETLICTMERTFYVKSWNSDAESGDFMPKSQFLQPEPGKMPWDAIQLDLAYRFNQM
jgi:hypothetical protein